MLTFCDVMCRLIVEISETCMTTISRFATPMRSSEVKIGTISVENFEGLKFRGF